jgi:hypothetical protein
MRLIEIHALRKRFNVAPGCAWDERDGASGGRLREFQLENDDDGREEEDAQG